MPSSALPILRSLLLLLVVVLGSRMAWSGEDPPAGAEPLPVDRSATLKKGKVSTWYVDGAQVIPEGVRLKVDGGTRIVGVNEARLEVKGGLVISGGESGWVTLENLDLSPTTAPKKGLEIRGAILKNVRLQHAEDAAFTGELSLKNSAVHRDCIFAPRLASGSLEIELVDSATGWTITCVPPNPSGKGVKVSVDRCWTRRVEMAGSAEIRIGRTEFKGGLVFRHVTKVTLDGCDITEVLSVHQGEGDSFRKIKFAKCNLFDGCTLILDREMAEGAKSEKLKIDRFYFGPREGPGAVTDKDALAKLVKDDADYEEPGILAKLTGVLENRNVFVDYGRLRYRVPPID